MSYKAPAELLKKIKDSVNIIEVVGEHVVLRKAGSNHSGLCPFHAERTPSFSVSEQKQLYHCYGCKKGGDLFTFVMEIYGIGFGEAIEELAERAKIALPNSWQKDGHGASGGHDNQQAAAARDKIALAYKLNRFAAAFFHQNLGKLPDTEHYIRQRGVSTEIIRNFYLGSASPEWDTLTKHLTAKKAPLALAEELGLIKPSPRNAHEHFDLFRNRAMFPILDIRGKVTGFGGRSLLDEKPKYLNSADSIIYQKHKLLFGLYHAQKHIREKDEVILVEGYFDVTALHAGGFTNVVATCGTALSIEHLAILRKFSKRITVLFDGDAAGKEATDRAMELALEQGIVIFGATLPEGMDPDEILLANNGQAQLEAIIKQAKPWLDSRIEAEGLKAADNEEAKTLAVKQVASWLARFKDPIGLEIRKQSAEKALGISAAVLNKAISANLARKRQTRDTLTIRPTEPSSTPDSQEPRFQKRDKILFETLIVGNEKSAKLLSEARANLPPGSSLLDIFESSSCRFWAKKIIEEPKWLEQMRASPSLVPPFDPNTEDTQVRSMLTEALVSPEKLDPDLSEMEFALKRALALIWARFSQHIKRSITKAESSQDTALQKELLKEYLDVQRKMKEFEKFYDKI